MLDEIMVLPRGRMIKKEIKKRRGEKKFDGVSFSLPPTIWFASLLSQLLIFISCAY